MTTDHLKNVSLNDSYFEQQSTSNEIRVWYTPDGDGVGLYYFDLPPDLPGNQATIHGFINEYLYRQGEVAIEANVEKVSGIPAVMTIGKVAQDPSGFTYVGSYTFPFRDFSYVIKIQCEERGTTGTREAVILQKTLANGNISSKDFIVNGKVDQQKFKAILDKLSMDDASYDNQFPNHPVSRCRKGLRHIKSTIYFKDEIKMQPLFGLPKE